MDVPDYSCSPTDRLTVSPTKPRRIIRTWLLLFSTVCLLLVITAVVSVHILAKAPTNFPINETITVPQGSGVRSTAHLLKQRNIIASEYLLYAIVWWYHDPTALKASDYRFAEPLSVYQVAEKLMVGDFTSNLIRFTHKEGERVTDIAVTAQSVLTGFDTETFLREALPQEGTLFPDTYLLPPDFSATELIKTMTDAYEKNMAPLRVKIALGTLSEREVVILASIIEREANSPESMRMVSGILQNRLSIGMALQTDASIEYILNKPLKDLTPEDLDIDSPYNTYKHRELPPTPIGNPGLIALQAVIEPTRSEYLYYITDSDGNFHYAKTFEEHKLNVARYLK